MVIETVVLSFPVQEDIGPPSELVLLLPSRHVHCRVISRSLIILGGVHPEHALIEVVQHEGRGTTRYRKRDEDVASISFSLACCADSHCKSLSLSFMDLNYSG